jgi:hypothetical protein
LQVIAGQLQHRTLATQVSIPRWAARVGRLVPSTAVLLACLSEPAAELANRHTLTNDRSLAAGAAAAAAAARVCACVSMIDSSKFTTAAEVVRHFLRPAVGRQLHLVSCPAPAPTQTPPWRPAECAPPGGWPNGASARACHACDHAALLHLLH